MLVPKQKSGSDRVCLRNSFRLGELALKSGSLGLQIAAVYQDKAIKVRLDSHIFFGKSINAVEQNPGNYRPPRRLFYWGAIDIPEERKSLD
jgi:hypothetical protein